MSNNTRSSRLATALATFLLLAMLATLGVAIWFARDQAVEEWHGQLDNLALVLAEQGAQEMRSAFLVLDSIAETVEAHGVHTAADLRTKMGTQAHFDSMRDKIRGLPQVDVATIVAANGDVVNFTRSFPAPAINLADRDYFQAQLRNPKLGVYISAPVRNKGNKQWTFYLSRRLTGANGEFMGLALVGFSSTFLSQFYKKINLGDDATITLYRRDYMLLARWPHEDRLMGKINRAGSSFHIIDVLKKAHGVVELSSPRFSQGGSEVLRMGAARLIDGYPLVINITVTDARFLAQWRRFSAALAIVGGLAALGMLVVFWMLIRLLKRREEDMEETRKLKTVAEAANLAKSDFLAMMSHEIRTPLTAIIGFAEILEKTQLGQPGGDTGAIILRNGQHLLTIINDILDISKIEAGRLPIEHLRFSPYELAEGVHAMMLTQAQAKGLYFELQVTYPLPAQVVADPTRWKQILFNLASNAIKFTELGGVRLALRYDSATGNLVSTVIDTGIGLSPEHQANLFRPFSQADSSVARKYGGTGLGLYLVSQLVARMNGTVKVDSSLGHGAVFEAVIHAPLPPTPAWLTEAPPAAPRSAQALRDPFAQRLCGHVLLAEDGRDNQTLVCAFLHGMGLSYEVVGDGAAAVEAALAGSFDMILMDIQMPVMDGVRAVQVLRGAGYARPIVALTANVMPEDIQRYAGAGFDGTVGKPINMAELVQAMQPLLAPAGALPVPLSFAEIDGYAEIEQSFRASLPERFVELAQAVDEARWADVATLAHKLKGAAGSFGFPEVTRVSGLLEVAAPQGARFEMRRLFEQLLALEELEQAGVTGIIEWQVS